MSSWYTKNDPRTTTMKVRNRLCVFISEAFAASLSGCWLRWPAPESFGGFMFSSLRERPHKLGQCAS